MKNTEKIKWFCGGGIIACMIILISVYSIRNISLVNSTYKSIKNIFVQNESIIPCQEGNEEKGNNLNETGDITFILDEELGTLLSYYEAGSSLDEHDLAALCTVSEIQLDPDIVVVRVNSEGEIEFKFKYLNDSFMLTQEGILMDSDTSSFEE